MIPWTRRRAASRAPSEKYHRETYRLRYLDSVQEEVASLGRLECNEEGKRRRLTSRAFYELGVRHALRPYTTIIISENGLIFPFDMAQIAVRKYHHLGEGIDSEEVDRKRSCRRSG
jgi:hypothetical protein